MTNLEWLRDLREPPNGSWYERVDYGLVTLLGDQARRLVQGTWPLPYQEVKLPGGELILDRGHIHQGVLRRPRYHWYLAEGKMAVVHLQDGDLMAPEWLEDSQKAVLHDWWDSIGRQPPQVRVIGLNALRLPREGELLYCRDRSSRVILEVIPWGDRLILRIDGDFGQHLTQWVTTPQEVVGHVEDWCREHLARAPLLRSKAGMQDALWHAWRHRKVQWTGCQLAEYLGEWARQVER